MAALAHDFPRLWNAPTTKTQDKKRILRLVIKDITVERFGERRLAVLHVRWQGGACEDIEVTLPDNIADRLRYPEEIIDRVRELARERTDEDVAAALNGEGRRSAKDESFNVSMIRWIRYKHRIPAPVFHRPGERSVRQVADELGVSRSVVYYWIDRGVLTARQRNQGSPYWNHPQRRDEGDLARLGPELFENLKKARERIPKPCCKRCNMKPASPRCSTASSSRR